MRVVDKVEFERLVKEHSPIQYAKEKVVAFLFFIVAVVIINLLLWHAESTKISPDAGSFIGIIGIHICCLGFAFLLLHRQTQPHEKTFSWRFFKEIKRRNNIGHTLEFHCYEDGTHWIDLMQVESQSFFQSSEKVIARYAREFGAEYELPASDRRGLVVELNLAYNTSGGIVSSDHEGLSEWRVQKVNPDYFWGEECEFTDDNKDSLKLNIWVAMGLLLEYPLPISRFSWKQFLDLSRHQVRQLENQVENLRAARDQAERDRDVANKQILDLRDELEARTDEARDLFEILLCTSNRISDTSRLQHTLEGLDLHLQLLSDVLFFFRDEKKDHSHLKDLVAVEVSRLKILRDDVRTRYEKKAAQLQKRRGKKKKKTPQASA